MNADDLFTAPQVARICSTDLKTIHNWVNRGEIKSFRTPGRHLRFRRQDILDFLSRFGYPIPDGFAPTKQRVVIVEHDDSSLKSLKRLLSREFDVEAFSDHMDALLSIGEQQPNLVLVGINSGKNEDNLRMVERLTKKTDGFQVAVYTGDSSGEDVVAELGPVEFIASDDGKEIRKRVYALLGR